MALPRRERAEAPPARDPHCFAPVFLLATARSCSSVVTAMIGQHPALCGLPELKLFASPTIGEMEASLPRFWIERGALAYPVSEVTIAGNLKDMFLHLAAAADLEFKTGFDAPTVRIEGMTVAGT